MRSPDHTALRFGEIRFCSPGRRVPRARASRTASSAWRTSRTRRVHNTRERWQLCSRRAGPRGVVMNRGGALSPFRPGTPARPRERSPLPLEGAVDAECPRAGGDRGSPGDSRARVARWEREGGARTMGGLLSRAHPLPRVHVARVDRPGCSSVTAHGAGALTRRALSGVSRYLPVAAGATRRSPRPLSNRRSPPYT